MRAQSVWAIVPRHRARGPNASSGPAPTVAGSSRSASGALGKDGENPAPVLKLKAAAPGVQPRASRLVQCVALALRRENDAVGLTRPWSAVAGAAVLARGIRQSSATKAVRSRSRLV